MQIQRWKVIVAECVWWIAQTKERDWISATKKALEFESTLEDWEYDEYSNAATKLILFAYVNEQLLALHEKHTK